MLQLDSTLPRVILIGGAPRGGKTTVAGELASVLGRTVISTDDLGAVARALVTREQDPDLHAIQAMDHREYHVSHPVSMQLEHALRSHRALWPGVRAVVEAHASWAPSTVIEGWALLPDLVAEMDSDRVAAVWLQCPAETLARRVHADHDFLSGARNPSMLASRFVERSVAFSAWLERELTDRPHSLVSTRGTENPGEIAEQCLRVIRQSLAISTDKPPPAR